MISRKFAYADDLALLHSSGNWKDLEAVMGFKILRTGSLLYRTR